MTKANTFKIKAGLDAMGSSVELNGEKISGLRRVSFDLNADAKTVLRLEIYGEVFVEGEFREDAILLVDQEKPTA